MAATNPKDRTAEVVVRLESPDQPDVRALLTKLDEYQSSLYPPESNHLLGVEALMAPDVRFLVARRNGVALGCGALKLERDGTAEVKRMYVEPAARGLGIGKALMRAIEAEGGRQSIKLLRLETGIHQLEAIGLYMSGGFQEIPAFPPYKPDPLSRFFAKQLPLSG
jgi:putative acetyltransferase